MLSKKFGLPWGEKHTDSVRKPTSANSNSLHIEPDYNSANAEDNAVRGTRVLQCCVDFDRTLRCSLLEGPAGAWFVCDPAGNITAAGVFVKGAGRLHSSNVSISALSRDHPVLSDEHSGVVTGSNCYTVR